MTDVTDAPGGEIPEEVVHAMWAHLSVRCCNFSPASMLIDMDDLRAALSAAGVGKLVEALGAAPIFSKYHTGSGFDYIRFADDYHAWKKQARSALSSFTDTRTAVAHPASVSSKGDSDHG